MDVGLCDVLSSYGLILQLVEECDSRLSEDRVEELIGAVGSSLPALPEPVVEEGEEGEDGGDGEAGADGTDEAAIEREEDEEAAL